MKNLLIGSRALDYWCDAGKDVLVKPSTDWDVISRYPIEGTEWHDSWLLNNEEFERFTTDKDTVNFNGTTLHVVTLEGLAIIKRSHLWRDLSFGKHISHYHHHLKRYMNNLSDWEQHILSQRIRLTQEAYPAKSPNLNQSVEGFFDDAVVKVFNHDWLHELYAHEDIPMYRKMQRDSSKAWCEKDMWDNFSQQQKINCIAEECYVIATERFLVPSNYEHYPKLAFIKALNKVCTTLCSGFFRDEAIESYPEVIESYDETKVKAVVQLLRQKQKG